MGNYSGEACLSGAVRTVIARGMVGYREANHAASATLAVASDFDYKKGVRDGGYRPTPPHIAHVRNKAVYLTQDKRNVLEKWHS